MQYRRKGVQRRESTEVFVPDFVGPSQVSGFAQWIARFK
jgi:hypothetical protein